MEKEKQLLISATTSKRRNLALAQLPEIDLKSHPGPENELDSPDTMLVAKNKIDYLVNLLQATLKQQETAPLASQTLLATYIALGILAIVLLIPYGN